MVPSSEIEARVLQAIDRFLAGHPIEDALFELKSEWPEPAVAARRLGGQANAARGREVIWIIGLRERPPKLVGASARELSTWWQQVRKCFEANWVPELLGDYAIPYGGKTVMALRFATDRAPYVVRNPDFGRGHAIEFEVPWREATAVRSAGRSDLLRILSPLQSLPEVEVLAAVLNARREQQREPSSWTWYLDTTLYLAPRSSSVVWFPFHRCRASINVAPGRRMIPLTAVTIHPRTRWSGVGSFLGSVSDSDTVFATSTEARIEGPGLAHLSGEATTPPMRGSLRRPVLMAATMGVVGSDAPVSLQVELPLLELGPAARRTSQGSGDRPPNENLVARWGHRAEH
jgi:hypothetical protein